jgi:hypothetical protein
MKQLNLIAVPNGAFTLEEALQDSTVQQAVQMIKPIEGTTTSKIKAFLSVYQMIDALSQMRQQDIDMSQLHYENFRNSMTMVINVSYDSIMKSFSNHERKMLQELVAKDPAQ